MSCPSHRFRLNFLIMFDREHKLCNSSLRNDLRPSTASSPYDPYILLCTFSQTPSVYVPALMSQTKFHAHTEQ
jgi:hypothetical protein